MGLQLRPVTDLLKDTAAQFDGGWDGKMTVCLPIK